MFLFAMFIMYFVWFLSWNFLDFLFNLSSLLAHIFKGFLHVAVARIWSNFLLVSLGVVFVVVVVLVFALTLNCLLSVTRVPNNKQRNNVCANYNCRYISPAIRLVHVLVLELTVNCSANRIQQCTITIIIIKPKPECRCARSCSHCCTFSQWLKGGRFKIF